MNIEPFFGRALIEITKYLIQLKYMRQKTKGMRTYISKLVAMQMSCAIIINIFMESMLYASVSIDYPTEMSKNDCLTIDFCSRQLEIPTRICKNRGFDLF